MKTVLITGATSGIGKATATRFAKEKYTLVITGRRIKLLEALKYELETSFQTPVHILHFDIREYSNCLNAINSLPKEFSDIEILINNAGLALGLDSIEEGKLEHWDTMIDTNVKGLLYITKIISGQMKSRRSGHIINVCSTAGKEVYPKGNVYSASKFAVDAITKSIRLDLNPYNIKVSQISPGHVEETEFAINRFEGDKMKAAIYSDFNPLKSEDVADAIYYIASRPAHVNIHEILLTGTQQASATMINRSGRIYDSE